MFATRLWFVRGRWHGLRTRLTNRRLSLSCRPRRCAPSDRARPLPGRQFYHHSDQSSPVPAVSPCLTAPARPGRQFYHRRQCTRCGLVPKEPTVCLLCGTFVCLRGQCCKVGTQNETVAHSVDCGSGTCIFLAVNSSTVIVIRGRRACLWGSVYLDTFGEEDRDLK